MLFIKHKYPEFEQGISVVFFIRGKSESFFEFITPIGLISVLVITTLFRLS